MILSGVLAGIIAHEVSFSRQPDKKIYYFKKRKTTHLKDVEL